MWNQYWFLITKPVFDSTRQNTYRLLVVPENLVPSFRLHLGVDISIEGHCQSNLQPHIGKFFRSRGLDFMEGAFLFQGGSGAPIMDLRPSPSFHGNDKVKYGGNAKCQRQHL
mmetsp:Transcript_56496/g.91541  ORF Transcript_56496/g.91541 Transcript_56496/m.91541 type:complete len:112 (-) Transcript_56496:18-353(-)